MAECEFCGEPAARIGCPYCKGRFHADCLKSHYVGYPRCAGDVPANVITAARLECGFYDEPEDYTPIMNPCKEGCDPEGCGPNCECQCHYVPTGETVMLARAEEEK
jgi:hypothetical protein